MEAAWSFQRFHAQARSKPGSSQHTSSAKPRALGSKPFGNVVALP
jgi:hypothetical protein